MRVIDLATPSSFINEMQNVAGGEELDGVNQLRLFGTASVHLTVIPSHEEVQMQLGNMSR